MSDITREQLHAYLDDALTDAETARVEQALRDSEPLRRSLRQALQERDRGEHSLGAVWRRERLTCPTRSSWGATCWGCWTRGSRTTSISTSRRWDVPTAWPTWPTWRPCSRSRPGGPRRDGSASSRPARGISRQHGRRRGAARQSRPRGLHRSGTGIVLDQPAKAGQV